MDTYMCFIKYKLIYLTVLTVQSIYRHSDPTVVRIKPSFEPKTERTMTPHASMSMPQYVNWKQCQTTVIGSVYGYKNLRLQFLLDCPNKVMFGGNP